MRENEMRARWADGAETLGGWLAIPDPYVAQIMAAAGFDWLCVDMQHGPIDLGQVVPLVHAISAAGRVPIVRVPSLDDGTIGGALDAGARGIIVPMVNTRADAEQAAAACRYAPVGRRSFGPARVRYQLGSDYFEHADTDVACIVMVETTEALGNLDAIAGTAGVDAVFVGPSDLGISLGTGPGIDHEAPAFKNAIDSILSACRHHRVVPGIYTDAATAAKRLDQGFRLVAIASDWGLLGNAAAAALRDVRDRAT